MERIEKDNDKRITTVKRSGAENEKRMQVSIQCNAEGRKIERYAGINIFLPIVSS
jgi:hypothetical protein